MGAFKFIGAFILSTFLLSGCSDPDEKAITALVKEKYAGPACLSISLKWPITLPDDSDNPQFIQLLKTLNAEGLVSVKHEKKEAGLMGYRLVDIYTKNHDLCYGHMAVDSIVIGDKKNNRRIVSFIQEPVIKDSWAEKPEVRNFIKTTPRPMRFPVFQKKDGQWEMDSSVPY